MKTKKQFYHNILKINKNKSLLINKRELNATIKILKDDKKQFLIKKRKTTNIKRQNQ